MGFIVEHLAKVVAMVFFETALRKMLARINF
jgi:hypothetical protein